MRRSAAFLSLPLFVVSLCAQQPAAPAAQPSASAGGASCPEMASALSRLMGADARQRDWPQLAL